MVKDFLVSLTLDLILLLFPNIYGPNPGLYKKFLAKLQGFLKPKSGGLSEYSNLSMWGTRRPTCNIKTLCDRCTPKSNRKGRTYAMANSYTHSTFFLGATAHWTNSTIIKITWKNDEPTWTEKWPLTKEKLQTTKTEWLHFHFSLSCIGEGNGNPLQCSCLENPRGGGAWWAAI